MSIVFNRYMIAGRGGSLDTWVYFIGDFCDDKEEAEWHIVDHYEDWARYAERYRIVIELDVTPPKEEVEDKINYYTDRIEGYTETRNSLLNLLETYDVE